jgi:hypothetical protein
MGYLHEKKSNSLNTVQLAKKEQTYELYINSKFDKTYKHFFQSYHNLILKENRSLFL